MAQRNPFTPSFGKVPPYIAGRKDMLAQMERAFEDGPGNPNLSSILVGPRGSGKTVLLASIANIARERGWIVASVSAIPGMLEDILERTTEAADRYAPNSKLPHVKEVSLGQVVKLEFSNPEPTANWRSRMNRLFEAFRPFDAGLLIVIDEVRKDIDEMITLASAYQHFVQEDKKVSLIMAGLPYHVEKLVDDKSISFLRRARQHRLGRIADAEIRSALRKTAELAGRSFDDDALDICVESSGGFPYMMQLVGYWAWEESANSTITARDALRGSDLAQKEIRTGVLDATYRELSKGDLRFLEAMLPDPGESTLAGISERMGVKSNYASKYKTRLLERGVIEDLGHGYLDFELPGFKDYLKERLS